MPWTTRADRGTTSYGCSITRPPLQALHGLMAMLRLPFSAAPCGQSFTAQLPPRWLPSFPSLPPSFLVVSSSPAPPRSALPVVVVSCRRRRRFEQLRSCSPYLFHIARATLSVQASTSDQFDARGPARRGRSACRVVPLPLVTVSRVFLSEPDRPPGARARVTPASLHPHIHIVRHCGKLGRLA